MKIYAPKGVDVFDRHELDPAVVDQENAEIDLQRASRGIPKTEPTVGMAISGGGIRSATFGLGVMEALKEQGVLKQLDYLSTVSGGGYIGSWLTANCLRNGGWAWTEKSRFWETSVRHLRRYSNYLSPQLGFFSADSWSIATIWIRNTMLIQITIFLALLTLFVVPQIGMDLFVKWPAEGALRVATFILFGLGVVGAAGNLLDLHRPESWVLKSENWNASALIGGLPLGVAIYGFANWPRVWWLDISISATLLSGLFLLLPVAVKLYALGQRLNGVKEDRRADRIRYGQGLTQVLLVVPMLIAAYLIASVMSFQAYWTFVGDGYSSIIAEALGHWWLPFSFAVLTFLMLSLCLLKKGSGWKSAWALGMSVVGASGVLYLLLCAIIFIARLLYASASQGEADWHCQILLPALIIFAFSVGVVIMIGMIGNASTEGAREWWSRMGAWLAIYAFAWTALGAFSIYPPWAVVYLGGVLSWGGFGGFLTTTLAGLWAGGSNSTGGEREKSNKAMEVIAQLAPFAFIVGLLGGTTTILYFVESQFVAEIGLNYWQYLRAISGVKIGELYLLPALLLSSLLLAIGFASRVDLNEFSLNAFYRSRLARCYLGASRLDAGESSAADAAGSTRKPHPFTGFDDLDDLSLKALTFQKGYQGPLHIVNCALNLGGAGDLAIQSRQAANFQFSPLHCGSNRRDVQLVSTSEYGGEAPTLAQVVSVSGAAASPNMGYHSSTPVAFLLTMFNVRLGWWFGNPSRQKKGDTSPWFSLRYLAVELLASATPDSAYLMISDGGHFENLAAYELIRRKVGVIICSDGEADGKYGFEGLGRLLRMCEVDFDAKVDIDLSSIRPDATTGKSRTHCAIGRISYRDGSQGWLVYIKASWKANEAETVQQYRKANPAFPHECTGDQFYSEDQFESYRSLGREAGMEAFGRYATAQALSEYISKDLKAILAPELITPNAFNGLAARLNELYARLGKEEALSPIAWQFTRGIQAPGLPIVDLNLAQHYFCMEALQLMEDAFDDLSLDDTFYHPDSRGWRMTFEQWVKSEALTKVWTGNRQNFGERFAKFWLRLGGQA